MEFVWIKTMLKQNKQASLSGDKGKLLIFLDGNQNKLTEKAERCETQTSAFAFSYFFQIFIPNQVN